MYKVNLSEIEHFNYKKNEPDLVDMYGNSINSEYFQGHQAAFQYCYDVISGEKKTGVQATNACKRFARDILDREDLFLDVEEVDLLILFANSLNHVKGPLVNQSIHLMSWMIFTITNIMGFYYQSGKRSGERRFQKAFVMVARGNAKSFLCSILSIWGIMVNENGKPYSCSAARTRQQARIVLDDAMEMLKKASVGIRKMFKIYSNHIECLSTNGKMESVSSDAQSLDGKRISGVAVVDELHAHTDASVYNTLKTGMGASKDPLLFAITTAGKDMDGICHNIMSHIREVNADITNDDRYFGIEYAIDENDKYDDEEVWIKANPSLGHAVSLENLKSELAEAQMNMVQRNDFITKHCNRFVSQQDNAYLDMLEFEKCAQPIDFDDYAGREVYLGLDLAQRTDLCSLAYIFPNEDGSVDIFTRNYLPRGVLKRVKSSVKQRYINWEEEDCVIFTESETTDFNVIEEHIREANQMFDVKACAYDPAGANQLANNLLAENIIMVDVRQGFGLSEPAKLFQALVLEGMVNYNEEDKVFHFCASNAVYKEGMFQDIMVHKPIGKNDAKVDSIIAVLTAMKLIVLNIDESSVYEDRDIIQL